MDAGGQGARDPPVEPSRPKQARRGHSGARRRRLPISRSRRAQRTSRRRRPRGGTSASACVSTPWRRFATGWRRTPPRGERAPPRHASPSKARLVPLLQVRRHPAVLRHVPQLHGVRARGNPCIRAVEVGRDLRRDARLDRPRRGRADAPARGGTNQPARDPERADAAPRRRERGVGLVHARSREPRYAEDVDASPLSHRAPAPDPIASQSAPQARRRSWRSRARACPTSRARRPKRCAAARTSSGRRAPTTRSS